MDQVVEMVMVMAVEWEGMVRMVVVTEADWTSTRYSVTVVAK